MDLFVQQTVNALALGGTYALLALGLAVVFSIMGLINFAHGELMTISGYTLMYCGILGLPFAVSVPLAILAAVLAAVAMERIAFRPVRGGSGATMQGPLGIAKMGGEGEWGSIQSTFHLLSLLLLLLMCWLAHFSISLLLLSTRRGRFFRRPEVARVRRHPLAQPCRLQCVAVARARRLAGMPRSTARTARALSEHEHYDTRNARALQT